MTVKTAVTMTADRDAFGISLKYGVNRVKAKKASKAEVEQKFIRVLDSFYFLQRI